MCDVIGIKDNSDVVEHLEKLLNYAKSGEVIGFAAVAVTKDENIIDGYTNVGNAVLATIAGLRILEHRITKYYVEMPEDE